LSQRQGKVSITPLIKPNALLLIGREDSVKTVIDLIQRLDQPVSPTTQFRFYALRHTSASSAQSTIQEFFANRAGMGVKVLVTADLRTNSIIVQASPRDVLEVEALVKRIDVATSAAENELRIFPLQNSLADDLAPILQSAISGQPSSTRSRSTATQGGGGAGPGGGGAGGQFGSGGGQLGGGAGGGGSGGGGAQATAAAQQTSQSGSRDRTAMLRFVTVDADGGRGLKSGILTDVHITADPRANSLIISAPSESMDLLAALVKQLDQIPSTESQIKVFTVVNGDALTLVQMLETLFGRRTTAAQGAGQGGGIAAAIGGIIANSVSGDSGLVALRLSVDQRTNSIVASGSASDLNIVEAILFRLDDSDIRQRKSIVYRLKNAPALDVATSLNEFLRTERQVQQISPGSLSPFEQIEREVVIVPEPVSNSLIVSATPRFFEEIKKVVEQLDARPPMVMIQVLIAEVGLNNVDEFGIELGLQDSVLFDRSLLGNLVTTTTTTTFGNPPTTTQNQTVQAATNSPGFDFNNLPLGNSGSNKALDNSKDVGAQGLSHFGVGRINNELGFGGLVLSASSESVSMLLRALSESRRLDVLSRPQIMSLDNQPAYIQVGQRVPRVTGTTVNTVGNINNTVTLEPVGLILGVTPRISPDGLVVMEIDAEKSEVGPESEGIPISISNNGQAIRSPRINLELAQTTVSAMSGQTVVLGGLITKSHLQVHRRVPYLSAVPVLGNLFRYDNDTVKRTELLIIMTPRVVRSEAEADLIKQTEAARMNWCLADAIKMHGASGLRGRGDEWTDTETIVIYPDNPDGTPGSVEDLPAPKADAKKPAGQSKEPADKPEPPVLLPKAAKPTPAEPLKLDDARGSDSAQFRPVAGPNAVWQAAFQGPAPAGPTAAPNNFRGLAAPAVGTVR
jgi:type II secretion system protein D